MTEPASDKTLARIRALLAKAEDQAATPHESELYFAKAAELMARYGVDRAMLAAADPTSDVLGDRVVVIEGAYHVDKQHLLACIAEELGCRAVLRRRWIANTRQYQVHLFGHASDLERVDVLYTSLLIQATNGMAKAVVPEWEHVRTFRVAWQTGFRGAVVRRLRQAEQHARQQVHAERQHAGTAGPSVALVLADRSRLVDAQLKQVYPRLRAGRTRAVSGSGYRDGFHAGTQADLGGARLTRPRGVIST